MEPTERALRVQAELSRAGVVARLFGGAAFAVAGYWDSTFGESRPVIDVDLAVEKSSTASALSVIKSCGGLVDSRSVLIGGGRSFRSTCFDIGVEVFADPLQFNQIIRLGPRILHHDVLLSSADLLATKLQVAVPKQSDIKDVVSLLASLDISNSDERNALNISRIAELAKNNWGFYHSTAKWIVRIRQSVDGLPLQAGKRTKITSNLTSLSRELDGLAKPYRWKMRNALGERCEWLFPWYCEI